MKGQKALILMLYAATLVVVLKKWYGQGNTGMPEPTPMAAPTYAYAIILVASSFVGDLATIVALGGFFAFWNQAQSIPTAKTPPKTAKKKVPKRPIKKG